MNVDELKKESNDLKENVNNLLCEFTKKTGLEINYMTVEPVLTGGSEVVKYTVGFDIRL